MADLISMHRFEDGHEVEFDRDRVILIEPAADNEGALITLDVGSDTRLIHLKESYDEVKTEIHLSTIERVLRRMNGRKDDPSNVPFA